MEANPAEGKLSLPRWRARLNLLASSVGVLIVLVGYGLAAFEMNYYLAEVNPTQLGHGVTTQGQPIDGSWVFMALLGAVGLAACAGLPFWRNQVLALRGAITQGLSGIAVLCLTLLGHELTNSTYFTSAEDRCFYQSCWPLREQTVAMAAPAIAVGLSLIVAALLVRRVRWWVRSLVPVAVWLAALAVQHAVWSPWLLPIFQGPPS